LEGTYEYPQDLDPATRLLFEEATATYVALSPTAIATYMTPEDFQHFWQTARERTGSSYSGLHSHPRRCRPPPAQIVFESRLGTHDVLNDCTMTVEGTDFRIP